MDLPENLWAEMDIPKNGHLVEDGAVGAEEGVLGETALAVSCANVESLALGLSVGVVA
jgi:hypothetical protein